MKLFITTAVYLLFSFVIKAQNTHAVYLEAGGPGIASINLDTRLSKKNDGVGIRVGVGYYRHDFRKTFYDATNIPIGINFLKGRKGKNFIELGAGITPVFASDSVKYENMATTFGHILIGYRYQPPRNSISFRIFFSPVFGSFGFIPYYGGASLGYSFRKKKK
jgi:hypothetical protein